MAVAGRSPPGLAHGLKIRRYWFTGKVRELSRRSRAGHVGGGRGTVRLPGAARPLPSLFFHDIFFAPDRVVRPARVRLPGRIRTRWRWAATVFSETEDVQGMAVERRCGRAVLARD